MSDMTHVVDDLELFALRALPESERARVATHLLRCPACREQARLLEEVALALPETLPQVDVPSGLRARVLGSARADFAGARRRGSWLTPARLALVAIALAVTTLGAIDLALIQSVTAARNELAAAQADRDRYSDIAVKVSHGGDTWYMAGREQWTGSGGTLFAPHGPGAAAYVIFHDLRPVTMGAVYTIWLVDADGRWTRAANFTPNGEVTQAVTLDTPVQGFAMCSLTIELQREGKRAGPVVMQSRIGTPAPQ